jgi:tetratricopeptide (TPR) repeat protein
MISQSGESMKKTGLSILVLVMISLTGCVNFSQLVHDPAEEVFVKDHLRKATENETRGDYLEALKHYKIALTMDSSNPVAAEGRNRVETLLKNSAEESYRRGLEAQKQGRYDEAQREFLTALRLRPDYPEALEKITSQKETEVKGHIVHRIRPGESFQLALIYMEIREIPIIARYNNLRDAKLILWGRRFLFQNRPWGTLPTEQVPGFRGILNGGTRQPRFQQRRWIP